MFTELDVYLDFKMKILRTIALALSLQASMALVAHATPAANNDPYDRLAEVAHRVCGETPMSGTTVAVGGSLDVGLSLSNILKSLADGKIAAHLKAGKNWYDGLRQPDIPASQAITVSCSEHVFDHMFDALLLTDRKTGRRIPRPGDLHVTYDKASTKYSNGISTPPTIIENNGGIFTQNQSGGSNEIVNPPIPHYPNGLYIGDLEVGNVIGTSVLPDGSYNFQRMNFFNGQAPNVPFGFSGHTIICDVSHPETEFETSTGMGTALGLVNITCRTIG